MIVIVDYGASNLRSVVNAFEAIGVKTKVSNKASDIRRGSAIVLPGVGTFGDGMKNLRRLNLIEVLNEEVVSKKKPYLGICLGLQFLAEKGEEMGDHQGFGWIKGTVRKIQPNSKDYRIPHVGWNNVEIIADCSIFEGIENPTFYFVHSYHLELEKEDKPCLVAKCWHGEDVTAAIQKNNIFGVQFHPEKSQSSGLALLRNFTKII